MGGGGSGSAWAGATAGWLSDLSHHKAGSAFHDLTQIDLDDRSGGISASKPRQTFEFLTWHVDREQASRGEYLLPLVRRSLRWSEDFTLRGLIPATLSSNY